MSIKGGQTRKQQNYANTVLENQGRAEKRVGLMWVDVGK